MQQQRKGQPREESALAAMRDPEVLAPFQEKKPQPSASHVNKCKQTTLEYHNDYHIFAHAIWITSNK